jgi:hypothetical protein
MRKKERENEKEKGNGEKSTKKKTYLVGFRDMTFVLT